MKGQLSCECGAKLALDGNEFAVASLIIRVWRLRHDRCGVVRETSGEPVPFEQTVCADCHGPVYQGSGPRDGWQLEDGRTVCHACCVKDLDRVVERVIQGSKS